MPESSAAPQHDLPPAWSSVWPAVCAEADRGVPAPGPVRGPEGAASGAAEAGPATGRPPRTAAGAPWACADGGAPGPGPGARCAPTAGSAAPPGPAREACPPHAGDAAPPPARGSRRILLIDLGRALALLAMASFHIAVDLELFGLAPAGMTVQGFWWYYARAIAGSFLLLAGLSLWLAHGEGIRWRAFARRQVMIAAAAALVSAATFVAMRPVFIYYGILHAILVASFAGLAVLRLPVAALLALTVAALALPWVWSLPGFDHPLLWWTGLSPVNRPALDFEPFFPWVAPLLLGVALGRLGSRAGLWARLAGRGGPWLWRLSWPGRHSLAVYLLHQPLLLALLGGGLWLLR